MRSMPATSDISKAIVAYCEGIDAPAFDQRILASSPRSHAAPRTHPRQRPWLAASMAAIVVLVAIVATVPGVGAGVERVFSAFTVTTTDRTAPLTIRPVDLERARTDVQFRVISPPRIAGASNVTIDEVSVGGADAAGASIVFELHGRAPGSEVMIVESANGRDHASAFFTVRTPANDLGPLHAPPLPAGHHTASFLFGEASARRMPAPASWVVHGTRVSVMSPPGILSTEQLRAIRSAMSR